MTQYVLNEGLPRNAQSIASQAWGLFRSLVGLAYWSIFERYDALHQLAEQARSNPDRAQESLRRWFWRRLVTTSNALILLWIIAIYLGESTSFDSAIDRCRWEKWERWPRGATPHRLVFIADPQLVDPHTYPGRPWPISTLTIKHTDNYLRRSYTRIQKVIDPESIFFLGDLFDGGREWATPTSRSPEERYRKYGDRYWLREFNRFSKIFFEERNPSRMRDEKSGTSRRIVASLPGNHDLGFGKGIQKPVRDRFNAYFGEGNRVDVLGNHTFVSLDTVSLSAKDQDGSEYTTEIWTPSKMFLDKIQVTKTAAVDRYLRTVWNDTSHRKLQHIVTDMTNPIEDIFKSPNDKNYYADFPVILLTHVPLFRLPGVPCGPFRERWPPTPPPPDRDMPVTPDKPNAIPFFSGYQYQNVLSRGTAIEIIDKLNGMVEYVFSGDDHDYCEVVHRGYPSPGAGVREITVKSLSYAMGIRKPGFVMVSLWNPIDKEGDKLDPHKQTLQTHLCLMPDQLGILIRYGILIGVSLITMFVLSLVAVLRPNKAVEPTILPSFSEKGRLGDGLKRSAHAHASSYSAASTISTAASSSTDESAAGTNLSARNAPNSRPRSASPLPSYGYGVENEKPRSPTIWSSASGSLSQFAGKLPFHKRTASWKIEQERARSRSKPRTLPMRILVEFSWSVWRIAWPVLLWFWWLWGT